MKLPYERGVSARSELFDSTPSERAKSTLFYLQRAGHFYCDTHYTVCRDFFPGFLIAYVRRGRLQVSCRGMTAAAKAGDAVLIDCHVPHAYRAAEPLEYIWIHFDGANSAAFFEATAQEKGLVFAAPSAGRIQSRIEQFLEQLRTLGKIDEVTASRRLHDLLCEPLYAESMVSTENAMIAAAHRFMAEHLHEQLTVAELARFCCLSQAHFTRLFKKHTGQSPHEYLKTLRIHHAKRLLKETELPVSEIAARVGYLYDTSFTTVFRSAVGISPYRFRNMPI